MIAARGEMSATQGCITVVVVIPSHNRWSDAREALRSLAGSDYANLKIVLIADGCTDGTVAACRSEFPDVKLLEGDGNLWWSGCINRGMEDALDRHADAVVWLNDDNVVTPTTISELVASHQQAGPRSIISGRVKTFQHDWSGADEWVGEPPVWDPACRDFQRPPLNDTDISVQHPPGGRGVLIPITCVREIGMVAEKELPQNWADHDFHYRAMKAGYQYWISAKAIVGNKMNQPQRQEANKFSLTWCRHTLFSRRSPLNMIFLHRLLRRNLEKPAFRRTYYGFLRKTLMWIASGWLARHRWLHQLARRIRQISQLRSVSS